MRKHVSVSDILKRIFSYDHVDPVVLKEKAKIGTDVHKAIVLDCADELFILQTDRAQAYFDSYKMLYPEIPKITQVPRLYCDKLMITGQCDGILDGKLIDWKCSANAQLDSWNMQAHFYWYLLKENGYHVDDKMSWINLRHNTHTFRDSKTGAIKRLEYTPKSPVVYEFSFDQNVLDRCISEAIAYWEEYDNAKLVVWKCVKCYTQCITKKETV